MGAPRLSHAESNESRALYERALAESRDEHWSRARDLLLPLWERRPTHDVGLLLGEAEYHLHEFREAAEHIGFGLATLPPREKPETAEHAKQILESCRLEVGALELRVEPKGAAILVDDRLVGHSPLLTELFVRPGTHRFEVRLAGHRSEAWKTPIAKGQRQSRVVRLVPISSQTQQEDSAPSQAFEVTSHRATMPPNAEPHSTSLAPVIAGGVLGVAGISAGVVFQLLRASRANERSDLLNQVGPGGCMATSIHLQERCDRLANVAADYDAFGRMELLSFLIGGVSVIASGTYLLVSRDSRSSAGVRSSTEPFRLGASYTRNQARIDVKLDF